MCGFLAPARRCRWARGRCSRACRFSVQAGGRRLGRRSVVGPAAGGRAGVRWSGRRPVVGPAAGGRAGVRWSGRRPVVGPASGGQARGLARADAARRRRRIIRRSSSEVPPHTPVSWLVERAKSRHASLQRHEQQTSFAEAIWSTAGPVVPTGKNRAGSVSRHAASTLQSIADANASAVRATFVLLLHYFLAVEPRWFPQRFGNNRNRFSFRASVFLKLVLLLSINNEQTGVLVAPISARL